MSIAEVLLIAFGVSVDAAAVSVSGTLCPGKYSNRHCAFNAALFFGGFQFVMPLAGFYLADALAGLFEKIDHYIAFLLLLFVGGKMIFEASRKKTESYKCPLDDFFAAKNLLLPAIATSIDAMAIGAGLALSGRQVWLPAAAMGIVTAAVSALCVIIGKKTAAAAVRHEKTMTVAGGVVIILIGTKILLQDIGVLPLF